MKKIELKKIGLPKIDAFFKGMTVKNLINDRKLFIAYIETIQKIRFDEDTIYSVKELSYKKERIKLAFKRLIAIGNVNQDEEWYYKNLPILEKFFLTLANFQRKKNKSASILAKTDLKDAHKYSLEFNSFNEFIRFVREKFFEKR
ncbi:hypothetical protein N9I94_01565, partial [Candidatus Pelagibacter sp.]|nr:hypothetical protein [Candidatus Pelagibacter sp.]